MANCEYARSGWCGALVMCTGLLACGHSLGPATQGLAAGRGKQTTAAEEFPVFQNAASYFAYLGDTAPAGTAVPFTDREGAVRWVRRRHRNARRGMREIVRLPLAIQSAGWGCVCPEHYIGDSPDSTGLEDESLGWLAPTFAGPPPRVGRAGGVVMAEGYFTGRTAPFVWEDAGETYTTHGFQVFQHFRVGEATEVAMQVLMSGEQAARDLPHLANDRPYLAIAATVPHSVARAAATRRLDGLLGRLERAGVTSRQLIDSRAARGLRVGFHVVLLGRYATQHDAMAAVTSARRSARVRGYVKRLQVARSGAPD